MKAHLSLLASAVIVLACEPATESVGRAEPNPTEQKSLNTASTLSEQPVAAKRPHEMTLHGHSRVDEYFWLRDDTRTAPEVLAYLEEENTYFDTLMEPVAKLQQTLFEEMTSRLDPEESSVPYLKDGYWYYSRYEPDSEYEIHARRKGSMEAQEEILLNGNQRGEGHEFYRLRGFEVSDDHRYVAIAEDTTGRRINEVRILDTQSAEFLPEVIANASGSLAFSTNGKYLFYLNKDLETLLAYQVMRHQLGTDSSEDVLVYEETDNTYYSGLERSRSGEFIMLVHENTDTTEVQLLSADNPLGAFKPFLPRETGHEYDIDHANGRLYLNVKMRWSRTCRHLING